MNENTKIANTPLFTHEETKQEKGPIIVEHDQALPVMGSKIGDDHIILNENMSSKFVITVKLAQNDMFEYVSEQVPERKDEEDDDKSDKIQEVEVPESFQPMGHELKNVKVNTRTPFLLRGKLREYQIIGLDWLKTLHDKKLNGILADEMGLGKTIQTISLLTSLAWDEGIWGPHLIVVPTTIIINWEMEFKRWCPGLKILTYFGSQKQRKQKRTGWSKDNSFHICITSYKLVIQDHFAFRRKKWYYMVLDEAQNIKNFRSQRWQTLLRFNTKRRLLLTGTPLQNDVMELWSLMHFLMPNIFSSQQDFKEWFSNPFSQSMNQNQALNLKVVQRLQAILRPFLLRRMKKDVEKQLPEKIEHIVKCELSRRQRFLYDEYINNNKTQRTLQEADFFSIMNVLMQLRKVCNHPDLFEPRAIESPFFIADRITYHCPKLIWDTCGREADQEYLFKLLNLILNKNENITIKSFISQIENFPQRSLVEVLQNARLRGTKSLMTKRPLEEGDSLGTLRPINWNELSINNTEALSISFPGYVPFSYLSAASMPFISSYFSLNSYNELKYLHSDVKFNPDNEYTSALQLENKKRKMMKFGEKLITFAHADYRNRLNLTAKPVYGKDCIEAWKVPLTFDSVMRHKKSKSSTNIKDLEIPCTIFNPLCKTKIDEEVIYNRFSNHTFSIENAAIFNEEKKDQTPEKDSSSPNKESKASQSSNKKVVRQPGFPLIIELKSRKNKNKSKKSKSNTNSIAYKPKFGANLSPVYSTMHGKVMYVMSAKLIKKVTMSIPKNIIGLSNSEYPYENISNDISVEVKDTVVHKKKKMKALEETEDIYGKEYHTTSENRRLKAREYGDYQQEADETDQQNNQQNDNSDNQKSNENQSDDNKDINKKDDIQDMDVKEQPVEVNDEDQQENDIQMNETENKENNQSNDQAKDVEMDHENENNDNNDMEVDKEDPNKENNSSIQVNQDETKVESNQQNTTTAETDQKETKTDDQSSPQKEKSPLEETKSGAKSTPEKNNEEEDESEEEYSGEGWFIGYRNTDALRNLIITPSQRLMDWTEKLKHYKFITNKVRTRSVKLEISKHTSEYENKVEYENIVYRKVMSHRSILTSLKFTNSLYFPHKNLVQYDCGKLHKLSMLLKTLKTKGSKVLIFTQMTKMLDLLEQFLNLHGYTYVRLDGSVKVEMRQKLVDNFNLNKKIFCFISSTRCGGIGINLTGADCVVFYDTDWNPAMDKQAQDRCHRIGQEKTVHIYRLISLNTIEENIFKKSLQKRELGGLIIEGNFDPDFFRKVNYKEILEEGNIIKKNIIRDENIVFSSGLDEDNNNNDEEYRRKYEEVLIRIEDEEDVEAYQNAKHEIDDEFEDVVDTGSPTNKAPSTTTGDDTNKEKKESKEPQDQASGALSNVKRHETIDWRSNQNLNKVTK